MKYFGESLFKIAVTWVEYSGFVTIEKNGTHWVQKEVSRYHGIVHS